MANKLKGATKSVRLLTASSAKLPSVSAAPPELIKGLPNTMHFLPIFQAAMDKVIAEGNISQMRKPRRSLDELNVMLRQVLLKKPEATQAEICEQLQCSSKTLVKLPAWTAIVAKRKGVTPPRMVALTDQMAAITPAKSRGETLARLVNEQQRDNRSNRVQSGDRR